MESGRRLILVGLAALAAWPAQGAEPLFSLERVSLYGPVALYEARMGQDAQGMAQFVDGVVDIASKWSVAHPNLPALTGVLVVVVKPGGRLRAWIVTREGDVPTEVKAGLKEQIEAMEPVVPVSGPLVFGFAFKLRAGGTEPEGYPSSIPNEWWPVMFRHRSGVSDAVLLEVWPDE